MTIKKSKAKFILAKASLDEVNKQLRINSLVIIVIILIGAMNAIQLLQAKNLFYGVLTALMLLLLFFMIKARHILNLKKQQLTQ